MLQECLKIRRKCPKNYNYHIRIHTPLRKIFFRVMLIDANNRSSARIKSPQLASSLPISNSYAKGPMRCNMNFTAPIPTSCSWQQNLKKEQHLQLLSLNHNSMISFSHEIIPKYLNASSIAASLSFGHGYAPLPSPFGLL